jgi:hypothetical protein
VNCDLISFESQWKHVKKYISKRGGYQVAATLQMWLDNYCFEYSLREMTPEEKEMAMFKAMMEQM